jgi:hypothetical protein
VGAPVPAFRGLDVDFRRAALQREGSRKAGDIGAERGAGELLAVVAMAHPDAGRVDFGLVGDVAAVAPAGDFHLIPPRKPKVSAPVGERNTSSTA